MGGWPQMDGKLETESISYVNTLLHSFGSRTFLDVTAGVNWQNQDASAVSQAVLDANTRSKVLPGLPQFFPEANPLDLLPNAMFNGTAMPGTIGLFQYERRFPFYGYNRLWNVSASLTRVARAHNIKTGVFVEDFVAAGAAAVGVQRNHQLQRRRIEPAQHERRLRECPARRHHVVPEVGRATHRGRRVRQCRVLRAGQLAGEANIHD